MAKFFYPFSAKRKIMFKSKKSFLIAAILFCAIGVLAVSANVKAETPVYYGTDIILNKDSYLTTDVIEVSLKKASDHNSSILYLVNLYAAYQSEQGSELILVKSNYTVGQDNIVYINQSETEPFKSHGGGEYSFTVCSAETCRTGDSPENYVFYSNASGVFKVIGSKPDLTITDVNYTTSDFTFNNINYTLINFNLKFKNIGNGAVSSPFYISVKTGSTSDYPTGFWGSMIINGINENITLPIGAGTENTASSFVTYMLTKGNGLNTTFTFGVDTVYGDPNDSNWISNSNKIIESNEDNNIYSKTVTIAGTETKPDLMILDVKTKKIEGLVGGTDSQVNFIVHYKNNSKVEITKPFYISVKTQDDGYYPSGFMASRMIERVVKPHENYSEIIGTYLYQKDKIDKIEGIVSAGVDIVYEDKNDPSYWINHNNQIDESNESNNTIERKMIINKNDDPIEIIRDRAKDLFENKFEAMRAEINELRDIIKEQQTQIKYLVSLKKDVEALSEKVESAINNFITYGVDENTKKLGAGERAAVMHSFKAAFNKLPETKDELSDAIKIANGRWPSMTSEEAEKEAKKQFEKIYKYIADMDNPRDNAAITVMAYGLRQKAENRNLNSEKAGIKIFKGIYGHDPNTTEDWNMMQAITYSGASRGADTDGDLLLDEREAALGTNPKNPDTDGDGFKDGEEVANGYDPLKK